MSHNTTRLNSNSTTDNSGNINLSLINLISLSPANNDYLGFDSLGNPKGIQGIPPTMDIAYSIYTTDGNWGGSIANFATEPRFAWRRASGSTSEVGNYSRIRPYYSYYGPESSYNTWADALTFYETGTYLIYVNFTIVGPNTGSTMQIRLRDETNSSWIGAPKIIGNNHGSQMFTLLTIDSQKNISWQIQSGSGSSWVTVTPTSSVGTSIIILKI